MAPTILDRVPLHFPAGTTVQFSRAFDQYPSAGGWIYTIYLNGTTQKFNKAALVQQDGSFLVVFLPADTASLSPGAYRYAERLSNPGTQYVLTAVVAVASKGVYSFSSFSGPAPYIGMPVSVLGFVNAGNNVSAAVITSMSGGPAGGTFTVANGAAVNEAAAATATGIALAYDLRGDELVINIEPNVGSSDAGAFVTFVEKTLAIIEAAITGRLTADIQSYQIAGRAVNKIPVEELMQLRGKYRSMQWRLQNPGKLGQAYRFGFPPPVETSNFPPTWVDVTGFQE